MEKLRWNPDARWFWAFVWLTKPVSERASQCGWPERTAIGRNKSPKWSSWIAMKTVLSFDGAALLLPKNNMICVFCMCGSDNIGLYINLTPDSKRYSSKNVVRSYARAGYAAPHYINHIIMECSLMRQIWRFIVTWTLYIFLFVYGHRRRRHANGPAPLCSSSKHQ